MAYEYMGDQIPALPDSFDGSLGQGWDVRDDPEQLVDLAADNEPTVVVGDQSDVSYPESGDTTLGHADTDEFSKSSDALAGADPVPDGRDCVDDAGPATVAPDDFADGYPAMGDEAGSLRVGFGNEPPDSSESAPAVGEPTAELAATEALGAAELEAAKAEARQRVGFHFVRAEHELPNAEAVAENLTAAGCRTVAFELVGATDEQRAELEAAMQDYHNRELAPEVRDEAGDKLLFASLSYIKGVIDNLTPTVERLRFFDISADHPDYAKVLAADEYDTATSMAMGTYKPNAVQRILLVGMLEAYADESIVREPLMAEQLVDMAVAEARLEPHTIGAVAGPAHVGHHQRVSAERFNCTTSPIFYTEGPATGAQFVVSLVQQLIRDRAQPLDPLQVDRAHVELIGRHSRLNPAEAAQLATKLPDDQLAPLLQVLEAAKQPGRSPEDIVIDTRVIIRRAYEQFVKRQA